jgi:CDGSH-type Zn-finger protein
MQRLSARVAGILISIMGCCGDKDAGKSLETGKDGTTTATAPTNSAGRASNAPPAPGAGPPTSSAAPGAGPPGSTALKGSAPGAKAKLMAGAPPGPEASSPPNADPKPLAMADSNTKVIAQRVPYMVEVVQGTNYYYCTCGRSEKQPLCDGKHKGTPFVPMLYVAEKTGPYYFCGCKGTTTEPKCDGSHDKLKW